MTYQEALRKEKKWQKRAMIINLFHNSMLLRKKNWTMRKTAKRLEMSVGSISENVTLAIGIINNPRLEELSRANALRALRYSYIKR